MIHHRTPEFDQILARVLLQLKSIFQTENPCYVLSTTGSGGMECLLVNTMAPKEAVLVINSGKFGERWGQMVECFGGELHTLKIPWGEAASADQVYNVLKKNPQIKLVLTQACETSTGTLHPIQEIGKMLKEQFPDILFLVDGITALGALPLSMDQWNIDGLVGGSQKAFMLPTGLSLLSFSKKAWGKISQNPMPRFYFDIRHEQKANLKGETFFSSNVSLIRALDIILNEILKKGLETHFSEIKTRAQFVRKYCQKIGFTLYSQFPSDSVTALWMPQKSGSHKFREELEKRFKITIMGGQDEAKDKIIRIGHMGYILPQQQLELMESLYQLLLDHQQIAKLNNWGEIKSEMKRDLNL